MAVEVNTRDLHRMRRGLRKIGRDLAGEVREVDKLIAEDIAEDARRRAKKGTRVQAFAAPAVKGGSLAGKGAVVTLGGKGGRSRRQRRNAVAFGAEFGAKQYPQFPRHRPRGYFYFPAIEAGRPAALERYADLIEDLFRRHT